MSLVRCCTAVRCCTQSGPCCLRRNLPAHPRAQGSAIERVFLSRYPPTLSDHFEAVYSANELN